ncbi:MAG: hypothetical protein V2J24_02540 [Pseudomonadales bacterium]|jgi:hypothetical protein|nr:hypothetical protein [Pseudomonadales bacterium]
MANTAAATAPSPAPGSPIRSPFGTAALIWGVGGFSALLLFAVWRLAPLALASTDYAWNLLHWGAFAVNLVIMGWFEGYRGFQQSYSPRLAARAHHLRQHATLRQALLAPLVCMGFLDAPRRRLVGAWALTCAIVVVVLLYRLLPQPWRGILDAGVVVGLLWGTLASLYLVRSALRDGPRVDAEIV